MEAPKRTGIFCRIGLHRWVFVAWADFGRGKIEACRRCPRVRTRRVDLAEILQHLEESSRADPPESNPYAPS